MIQNKFQNLIISRQLNTLRGNILEEHVTSAKSSSSSKGLPHREVISHLIPELDLSCLRLADSKIAEKLIEFDEQYVKVCSFSKQNKKEFFKKKFQNYVIILKLIKNHKIGVLLCKAGQATEEEMYNNSKYFF